MMKRLLFLLLTLFAFQSNLKAQQTQIGDAASPLFHNNGKQITVESTDPDLLFNMITNGATSNWLQLRFSLDEETRAQLYYDRGKRLFGMINMNNGIYITETGNVGVNTLTPRFTLDVNGDIASDRSIVFNPTDPESSVALSWKDDVARIRVGGNTQGAYNGFDIQSVGDKSLLRILHDGDTRITGGLTVNGANATSSVNSFLNFVELNHPSHAAIVYNSGQETELMFGFHSNGNFYWGTGKNNGNTYAMQLSQTGNLGIKGKLTANEVKVKAGGWADFVFSPTYRLRPLKEVESFIEANGHLPEIPSEEEVKANGVNIGEMDAKLLQKIEELTLYMIEMEKRLHKTEQDNSQLRNENERLTGRVIQLEEKKSN